MTDLILLFILLINAFVGLKKGFVKTFLGFTSTVLSFLLTAVLYRPFSDLLYECGLGEHTKVVITEMLQEKSQQPLLSGVTEQAAEMLSQTVLNVISFVLLIIFVKLILGIVLKILNVVAKLPVIKQANSLLGMLSGLAIGVLICYIIIGILSAINNAGGLQEIKPYLENSYFVSMLYERNLMKDLLSSFLVKE